MNSSKLTYISLFSSAGVGCYGFKSQGFECIATNELIPRRLDIQRFNDKCKYNTGYICGDISEDDTKKQLLSEIELWKKKEKLSKVDVIVATPPCQGMSVANHKKSETEIIRNSLVVESIKLIKDIKPRFFVLENVAAFMKTICTDIDGVDKSISDAIQNNLGGMYSYVSQIINFKDYGACSSRQRTLVIGVLNELADEISPYELYPSQKQEKTLRDVIGELKSLNSFGEIDDNDIYHAFRVYPEHMRNWICDLKEGQSAFENEEDHKKPHQIKDGKIVINQQKNGDKYKRQFWDKVGPCIHTRNDQLASQNTVHPTDDRVFSIRELMQMMTVPNTFRWVDKDITELNNLSDTDKRKFLKKEEIKIRQSLGEAVPTAIFKDIAGKICFFLDLNRLKTSEINKIVAQNNFESTSILIDFIKKNDLNLSNATLRKVAELSNTSRTDHAAFFTSKALITEILKNIPNTDKESIRILEPSVGVGNFISLILKRFEDKKVILDVVDIDNDSLNVLKTLMSKEDISQNITINYIHSDFLLHHFDAKYDYVIGNPPFYKMKSSGTPLSHYRKQAINKNTTNICSFFLDKVVTLGSYVALVFPKFILNTPEFKSSREYLSEKSIDCIIDFGEKGFPGVLVETIGLMINNAEKPTTTKVQSYTHNIIKSQEQKYIFDGKLPYWIIYRDELFDNVAKKLDFNVFTVFRDRQIVNKHLSDKGAIRVLKSRNVNDLGTEILDVDGYDSYISEDLAKQMSVSSFLNNDNVFLTPNMTYKPRVIRKPLNVLVNGSLAILIPRENISPNKEQLAYFSSEEYRTFYQIARNYQTRSLNVDACSVYFYGLLRAEEKAESITERITNIKDEDNQISLF